MLRIGLTGGMGAGKSTVARMLVERGVVLVDSDAIAREVVAPGTEGLAALVAAFGPEILAADGSLDRPALAARAFADDEARATLNGITHPLVGRRTAEIIAAAPADAIVVQDIPLLVENGLGSLMNLVVVVLAETETRIRRLTEFRGIDRDDALARIRAQATDEQRRAAADVLLDNNGDAAALEPQVRRLWEERLVPFEHNLRARTRGPECPRPTSPDPEWEPAAQRLIGRLAVVCGAGARRIDHIGPTAVPGLPARDVIDIQITVADLDAADALREPLEQAGFPRIEEFAPDDPASGADPGRWGKRVHGTADPGRAATVHLRVDGWPNQRFALAFRDWLRADPGAREEYLAVEKKAEAATAGLTGEAATQAYLEVRNPWLAEVYPRVLTARD
ncbi:dephospho-CoA kinase [Nocardia terpenica]|uniref:dephospho-CoA kinase n=1 Tax=Nocardia terpenica TaxID=455432 RepID=UPI0018941CA0|nr:dephospho-CoA kinase [Nocardia terpenica]MBF6066355.1 dephospho-CoA kinase [Nocardia terpenica]MBF6109455.1 dephospho-CoA kinase [Nocardia terpenica]MBF6116602.1 dephospho-CoA kinase [Nocardia terpenica]MBF6123837.1 dephospho-CoA kinase [Nocardia terpenica]MBF6157233.1 dephospho-CoA kinase [Nocardia terpenica]